MDFKLAGSNMSSKMFSALERIPGGSDRLMNSIGLRESVPAAKAGIASTQKSNAIRDNGNVGEPMNCFHDGESYTSDM